MSSEGQCRHPCNVFSRHTSLNWTMILERIPSSFVIVRVVSFRGVERNHLMSWQFSLRGRHQLVIVCPVTVSLLESLFRSFDVRSHERIMTLSTDIHVPDWERDLKNLSEPHSSQPHQPLGLSRDTPNSIHIQIYTVIYFPRSVDGSILLIRDEVNTYFFPRHRITTRPFPTLLTIRFLSASSSSSSCAFAIIKTSAIELLGTASSSGTNHCEGDRRRYDRNNHTDIRVWAWFIRKRNENCGGFEYEYKYEFNCKLVWREAAGTHRSRHWHYHRDELYSK